MRMSKHFPEGSYRQLWSHWTPTHLRHRYEGGTVYSRRSSASGSSSSLREERGDREP
ncbi:MAG: hypothetical protein QW478_11945 [Candidatus Micrarchaeaceae archaeon]